MNPGPDRGVVPLVGFVCIVLALPLSAWNAVRLTQNMTYGDPFFVVAVGCATVMWLDRRRPRTPFPSWIWVVAGAFLFTGLVATFRTSAGGNLVPLARLVITLTALPFATAMILCTPRRLRLAAEIWIAGVALSAFVGIVDLELNLGIGRALTGLDFVLFTRRTVGFTLHPNHLGITCAMALPVAAILATSERGPRRIGGRANRHLLYALLLFVAVLLSGSRAGVVGAVVGLMVAPMVADRKLRSPVLVGLVVLTFAGLGALTLSSSLASSTGLEVAGRLSGDASAQGSDRERRDVLQTARNGIEANPFVGEGYSKILVAHIIYVQLLQAGGIAALIAFLFMVLASVSDARWIARRGDLPPPDRLLAAGLAGGVVAWAAAGLAQNAVYDRYLYVPIGLLLASRALAVRSASMSSVPTPDAVRPDTSGLTAKSPKARVPIVNAQRR